MEARSGLDWLSIFGNVKFFVYGVEKSNSMVLMITEIPIGERMWV
jgi:hypothetical protein